MYPLSFLALAIFASGALLESQRGATALDCARKEMVALRDAPLGASRATKHRLTVKWRAGIATFQDTGFVEGSLGGIGYVYCGYAAGPRVHLISKYDGDLFTGVLLSQVTGMLMPAGISVAFAPDLSYFATTQPDGLDGDEWSVYSSTGVRQWKGLSGISARHPTLKYDYFIATLEAPHWSARGELQATLR